MNSTTKTVLIVLVIAILLGILFSMNGWNLGNRSAVVDDQYSDLFKSNDSDDTNPAGQNNTNGTSATPGSGATGSTRQTPPVPSDSSLMVLISGAKIRVPQTGVDVMLSGGEANFTDSAVKGHVSIGRILAKVPTDSGYDVFTDMTITTEGKPAVIHYVALFRALGQGIVFTSAVNVGDRVALTSLTAVPDTSVKVKPPQSYMTSSIGYVLTLSYLDRKNGEPATAAPSLAKTLTLRVDDHIVAR